MSDDQDGYEWVFLLVLAYISAIRAVKRVCVCACVCVGLYFTFASPITDSKPEVYKK